MELNGAKLAQIPIKWRAPLRRASIPEPTDGITRAQSIFTTMRTTLALDDDLVATAQRYTGLKEKSALVREALRAFIERESARRLAALGGSEPGLKPVARLKTSA